MGAVERRRQDYPTERLGPCCASCRIANHHMEPPFGFYEKSFAETIRVDGDVYKAIDVIERKVKVLGIVADWASTITYYANCVGLL